MILCETCIATFGEKNARPATVRMRSLLDPDGYNHYCDEHAVHRCDLFTENTKHCNECPLQCEDMEVQTMTDIELLESLQRKIKPRVLEWKTRAPFDGCFWQYSYALVSNRGMLEPIVITGQDKALFPTLDYAIARLGGHDAWRFDSFRIYDVNKHLWKEVPDNNIPTFWHFFNDRGEQFVWNCDRCGLTTNRPDEMSGYKGNGGIGITSLGWYCEECLSSLSCAHCGEINDPNNAWWDYDDELTDLYNRGMCPACQHERY